MMMVVMVRLMMVMLVTMVMTALILPPNLIVLNNSHKTARWSSVIANGPSSLCVLSAF